VETWSEAVGAWETYLEEVPEDAEKLEDRLAHARKYAQLSADYADAQEHIRKKQFNRAISKLQGIITQDPTYKATSRLLTEAVEGSRQRKPVWRSPWLFGGAGVILVVILGLVFGQQIVGFFTSQPWQGLFENVGEQTSSVTPTSVEAMLSITPTTGEALLDGSLAQSPVVSAALHIDEIYQPILEYIESYTPTFEDGFSDENQEWSWTSESKNLNSLIKDNQLVIIDDFDGGGYLDSLTAGVSFSIPHLDAAEDFALAFDFAGNEKIESINMRFGASLTGDTGYQIAIEPNSWELSQLADGTILEQGQAPTHPADRSSNRFLLIVKDAFAVLYLNYETVFERDDLIRNRYLKQIEVVASEEGGYVCFDNFQLWDLEEVKIDTGIAPEIGSISNWDTVQAYMDNQTPTFEDDFSEPNTLWDDFWSDAGGGQLEDLLNDGHLSIPDQAGVLILDLPVKTSDFIISYELTPQGDFELFNLIFGTKGAQQSKYVFSLHGLEGMYSIEYHEEEIQNVLYNGNFNRLELSKTYTVLVVAEQDAFAVYWDGDLLYYNTSAQSSGNDIYFACESNNGSVIDLDNIRLWDLEGVDIETEIASEPTHTTLEPTPTPAPDWVTDFAEPILAYIEERPPEVEDQFEVEVENEIDTYNDMWVFDPTCPTDSRSLSVKDGELSTNCQLVNQAVTFKDYVIEVDVYVGSQFQQYIPTEFPINTNSCLINTGIYLIDVRCDEKIKLHSFISVQTGWKNLRLIVKGSSAAIYLDEKPIGYFEIENKGLWGFKSLGSNSRLYNTQYKFSNFKAWNLTDFNFP